MMDYKKSISVLMEALKKYSFNDEEKEAILTAIGVLDFASLGKNRMKDIMKARKAKRGKATEW